MSFFAEKSHWDLSQKIIGRFEGKYNPNYGGNCGRAILAGYECPVFVEVSSVRFTLDGTKSLAAGLTMQILLSVLFPILGYLFGSLPFSVWVTRFAKGVDVRDAGSGHATTTNTIRQAGFGWGALVAVLDVTKGFVPVYLALHVAQNVIPSYIVPLTAACAVAGHCWPLFAQFRGGMGIATFGGALIATNWISAAVGLVL